MDVASRDRLAMAPAGQLRASGFDIGDDFTDCANPGADWSEVVQVRQAAERQRRAVSALGELTAEDAAALLEALRGE